MLDDPDLPAKWSTHLDAERLEQVEARLEENDSGEAVEVPEALAATLLGRLFANVDRDIRTGEIDHSTHEGYVYAAWLNECVHGPE